MNSVAVRRFILDVVYPPRCAGCLRRGHWVCNRCRARFPGDDEQTCRTCGRRWCTCGTSHDRQTIVFAFGPHEDWLRQAIISFKYRGEWARKEHLGALLVPVLEGMPMIDMLVPVPLHSGRERVRGYNQARLLAEVAGSSLWIPVVDALRRNRDTPQQVMLTGDARRMNVAAAFAPMEGAEGAHVVLIDDVVTTGATIDACANALRGGGAASVRAVTLSHG